ncbi:beta-lactamase/transpeptidase-like protein [Penicillium manginii]|uniref:beta-lactamase/transpeptidase-like protein n=1 Tax=Penicillium manginii TaxID=203109 RepID=UPI0025499565|nr:beta-lactamase/transpeptidase-like protein [Penicillium manginii]KAJ5739927.1 beta-lactamase/transpeptidase-like protein [Penicillium manginii]
MGRMAQIQGHCETRFSKLRDLMQEFIASGQDIGASLCININGDNVKPWEKDTVVNVFSTTKLVTNLAALMLISRGLLAPEDKVAKHWPEFAANGKSEVTVGQILAHTAGLSAWKDNMKLVDLYDLETATNKLARQAPLWPPGTAMGYHGLTQGFIVGELVRRKTGMSIDKFVKEEICQPLGDGTDFQLGCRKEDWSRVAPVIPPPGPSIQEVLSQQAGYEQDSIVMRTLCNPEPRAEDANTELWRSSTLGSVNGHTNARALVKILSCFSLGGICAEEGHRLLSSETVKLALTEHATGIDLVTGRSGRRGLGIYLTGPGSGSVEDKLPEGNVGWGSGWGGFDRGYG